ncbi:MAG TPA: shikimate kinase [Candidatus Avimonas sp.]|nr:shikimate kinase [Clostridiales bacterium]HPU58261.1 shikimate kinase [Candidatus Avimonas sp.]
MRNIVLAGFMGSGKTTVGKLLAELTGRRFVDMDIFLEQEAGMAVQEIFKSFGEEEFRKLEREACRKLSLEQGLVIATGGGAMTFPENVEVVKKSGDIVFLDVPLKVILKRLENDKSRPLLAGEDREEAAKRLYEKRLPLYRAAADIIVDGAKKPSEVADEIIKCLESR